MSSSIAGSFRVCLTAVGLPRRIVMVSEVCTLGDLYRVASESFYSPVGLDLPKKNNPRISLSSGFPPQLLENCPMTTVRSVLTGNDRVNVILIADETKAQRQSVSRATEASPLSDDMLGDSKSIDKNRPSKKPRLDAANGRHASLKILSWNIAECRPSHDAPPSSHTLFDCQAAVVQQILRQEAQILCLQECPSSSWMPSELLDLYTLVGSAPSHCGVTQLWIHNALDHQRLETIQPPSVAATVLVGDQIVGVSSSHLEPFNGGAPIRLEQATNLFQLLSEVTPNFIMAGDYNMRKAEDCRVEQLGLHDVFKLAGSPKHARFTWDSIRNKYHGPLAYGFHCRFDRIYVSYEGGTCTPEVTLVGDEPEVVSVGSTEYKFFLSDHFGMVCTLQAPAV